MAAANGKILETVISIGGKLDPSVAAAINKVEIQLKHFSDGFVGLEKKALATGAAIAASFAAAGAAAGTALYNLGAKFDDANKIIRVGTGSTGEQLEALNASARAVYQNVPHDLATAATAIADLNTLMDASGAPAENLAKATLRAAALMGEDGKQLTQSAARAFNAFKIGAEQGAKELDFFFKTSQATGVGMNELFQAVQANASSFQFLGMDLEHAAALMGNIKKAGLEDAAVLAGLKKAVQNMTKAGIKDYNKGMQNLSARIKNAKTDTAALEIATKAFGAKAAPAMAKAIRAGALDLEKNVAALKANGETIEGVYFETETFSEALSRLWRGVETAFQPAAQLLTRSFKSFVPQLEKLRDKLMPRINRFVEVLAKRISDIAAAIKKFDWSRLTKYMTLFADKMRQIGDFIRANRKHFLTLGKAVLTLVAAFHAVQAATAVFSAVSAAVALVSSPVFLTIGALAALVTAAWYVYDNWEEVCAYCSAAWTRFTSWISDAWAAFADKFPATARVLTGAWRVMTDAISAAWTWTTAQLSAAMGPTSDFLAAAWKKISAAAEIAGKVIAHVWKGLTGALRLEIEGVSSFILGVFHAWPEIMAASTALMSANWDGFCKHFKDAAAVIKADFLGVWREMEAFVKNVMEHIMSFLDPLIDKIDGLRAFLQSAGENISGAVSAARKITGFAAGGFTSGPALCGEAGTEAVISFDPRYRAENRAYIATAAEMLGMTAAPAPAPVAGSVTNLGGITFAPVINGGGSTQDIISQLRAAMPQLVDMLEDALAERQSHRYA